MTPELTAILGVDPGLSGALTLYDTKTAEIEIRDMPVHRLVRGGKAKTEIDLYGVANILDGWNGRIKTAYVERVASSPQMGTSSAFAFGRAAGIVLGALAAHFIAIEEVPPVTWRRAVGIKSQAGKDTSRALASALFPRFSGQFARVKDDGRAEATLIAVYGARQKGQSDAA